MEICGDYRKIQVEKIGQPRELSLKMEGVRWGGERWGVQLNQGKDGLRENYRLMEWS